MNVTERKIKMLLAAAGKSQTDAAQALGMSQPSLNKKMARETLKREELETIARTCGATWRAGFVMDDGTEI